MDTLRGSFDSNDFADDQDDYQRDWDVAEEDRIREAPPIAIGTDERRMQVRAYNHWASLLDDRSFPSIEDLEPDKLPDFGPYSVLLDFTLGMDNPGIQYLGDQLAVECGAHEEIDTLSDVPSRSLLSRITDHYMQILGNQAPIGFEAEFVNQRGSTILYRGILLPFSSNDEDIDFIFGVINWKEMADQQTADELLLEIDQALEIPGTTPGELPEDAKRSPSAEKTLREPDPVTDWADGPGAEVPQKDIAGLDTDSESGHLPRAEPIPDDNFDDDFPVPSFGAEENSPLLRKNPTPESPVAAHKTLSEPAEEEFASLVPEMVENPPIEPVTGPMSDDEGLYDCLAAARELANAARSCEDRSRSALYAAVGRAYDFSLVAQESQAEFDQLVTENGLTVQERAPMTPVVKLVFGADYDKTRLTEYAAVLSHAHRMNVGRGMLSGVLAQAEGGLKGVVQAERKLRREEGGKQGQDLGSPQERLARKLRDLEPQSFEAITAEGEEFGLVMIRRLPTGNVILLGEISGDIPLFERAARKLVS